MEDFEVYTGILLAANIMGEGDTSGVRTLVVVTADN